MEFPEYFSIRRVPLRDDIGEIVGVLPCTRHDGSYESSMLSQFPNDAAITRLVGAMMLKQNDEWSLNRRYMQLEGLQTISDTAPTRMSAVPR